MKTVYLNFEHKNPAKGCIIKTNLPLNKLAMYLASLIIHSKNHDPLNLAKKLPNSEIVSRDMEHEDDYSFAEHIFNSGAGKNVPLNKYTPNYISGILVSNAKHDDQRYYVMFLNKVANNFIGTNMHKYHKIAKKLIEEKAKAQHIFDF